MGLGLALAAAFGWPAPVPVGAQASTPVPAAAAAVPESGTLVLQGQGAAQDAGGRGAGRRAGAAGARPTLTAVRTMQPPTVDGRLDDVIWQSAALIDTFVQEEPQEGQPSTEKTELRVAYDADKLYFGIYAHYSDVDLRRANRSDRDKLDDDDRSTTTYQFTPRLLLRSISEFNVGVGANHTVFQNLLATYRVNSGTVFYVGYDDRFKQGNAINDTVFTDTAYQRTNRAVFTKLQYLFRNGRDT